MADNHIWQDNDSNKIHIKYYKIVYYMSIIIYISFGHERNEKE